MQFLTVIAGHSHLCAVKCRAVSTTYVTAVWHKWSEEQGHGTVLLGSRGQRSRSQKAQVRGLAKVSVIMQV